MRKDYNLEKRKFVIAGFIIVLVCIYIVRLFVLQVGDSTYKGALGPSIAIATTGLATVLNRLLL